MRTFWCLQKSLRVLFQCRKIFSQVQDLRMAAQISSLFKGLKYGVLFPEEWGCHLPPWLTSYLAVSLKSCNRKIATKISIKIFKQTADSNLCHSLSPKRNQPTWTQFPIYWIKWKEMAIWSDCVAINNKHQPQNKSNQKNNQNHNVKKKQHGPPIITENVFLIEF